jgi:hypothetical protein
MRGANGGRRKALPFRIEPEGGQVPENFVEGSGDVEESGHVLQEKPSRSEPSGCSCHLGPEPSFVSLGEFGASDGDGLAGEPADEHVDVEGSDDSVSEVESIVLPVDAGDVAQVGDVRPVFAEDAPGVGVDFGLPSDGHAGGFEAEVDAADAGEE